jgi:hypothetical protein
MLSYSQFCDFSKKERKIHNWKEQGHLKVNKTKKVMKDKIMGFKQCDQIRQNFAVLGHFHKNLVISWDKIAKKLEHVWLL